MIGGAKDLMQHMRYEDGFFINEQRPVARLLPSGHELSEDTVTQVKPGIFLIQRTFSFDADTPLPPDGLVLSVAALYAPRFYEIPAVSYNGNHWGTPVEPKGLVCNGAPWVYAHTRATVPGATYSEDDSVSLCLLGDTDNPPFSMSLAQGTEGFVHSLLTPQREGPFVYFAKGRYQPAMTAPFHAVGSVTLAGYAVFAQSLLPGEALKTALAFAWERFSKPTRPRLFQDKLWEYGIRFAKESVFFEKTGFSGFCMGLYLDGVNWVQKQDVLEIGWVGQNASLAATLAADYIRTRDQDSLERALAILDCWKRALLPNGLFRCRFDRVLRYGDDLDHPDEQQDAANLFGVVRGYLRAYHELKKAGINRADYREIALSICRFALNAQQADGRFAKCWYNDGSVADGEGTIGAYMAWALLEGYEETGEAEWLLAAQKGFAFYDEGFKTLGYTTAGALDTYCIDKESSMPMVALAVTLYEITGDQAYLKRAEHISWYLATWQYHYTVSYPSDSLLARYGYDTLGATSVSTQHQHVDAYALQFFRYWIKLAQYTGEEHWRERAYAIWNNATQFVSDGHLVIDGQVRPMGSQDEGVCQTRWHTSRGEFFHTSRWLVCWNGAFRLEILCDEQMRDEIKKMEEQGS